MYDINTAHAAMNPLLSRSKLSTLPLPRAFFLRARGQVSFRQLWEPSIEWSHQMYIVIYNVIHIPGRLLLHKLYAQLLEQVRDNYR